MSKATSVSFSLLLVLFPYLVLTSDLLYLNPLSSLQDQGQFYTLTPTENTEAKFIGQCPDLMNSQKFEVYNFSYLVNCLIFLNRM